MKKIIIALVVLVLAVAAAGPYLIGSQIEKMTKNLVNNGNNQLAYLVQSDPQFKSASMTLDQYEKGYLESRASGVVKIALEGMDDSDAINIPYRTEITHGPYLFDAGFGLAKIVTRPDLSGFDLPEAINADTVLIESVVDFNQAMTDTLTVAPIKHTAEDMTTIEFAGAKINSKSHAQNRLTFTADVNVEQLTISSDDASKTLVLAPFKMDVNSQGDAKKKVGSYEATSGEINLSMGNDFSVVMQKMAISGNYQPAKGAMLMLGDGVLDTSNLVITNPRALLEPLTIPELKLTTKLAQDQSEDLTISMNYKGTLDPSIMKIMKSPVDVKTADIGVQFKSIPVDAVTEYQDFASTLANEKDPQKAAAAMQAKMFELVQMLAQNAASTHITINANTTEGDLVADIDTGFKPGVDFNAARMMQILASPDPRSILPLLVGRGDISLSKGITDKAGLTPMIQFMAAEYVTLKDDTFVSELQISDGQLLINDTPLP